jgi:hypothetical protein
MSKDPKQRANYAQPQSVVLRQFSKHTPSHPVVHGCITSAFIYMPIEDWDMAGVKFYMGFRPYLIEYFTESVGGQKLLQISKHDSLVHVFP